VSDVISPLTTFARGNAGGCAAAERAQR